MTAVSCTLGTGPLQLSARRSEPVHAPPKATVVAIPGGGYTSAYWDHPKYPEASLLNLGAHLGYRVVAVDRPGYGVSSTQRPNGVALAEQVQWLMRVIQDLGERDDSGAGIFLIGHSMGGILALLIASTGLLPRSLGLDVSGVPYRFSTRLTDAVSNAIDAVAKAPSDLSPAGMFYGPLPTYDASLLTRDGDVSAAPCPLIELQESQLWPTRFDSVVSQVRVPVQFTLGEYETVTRCDASALHEITALFTASPRVLTYQQPGAGHNVSLHHVGRAYHLRAFAFFDEILAGRG
jgi:pimeloyl-ACP methyl ester carboxylesterase